jgi:LytS/YehU family sensor histidine kinase
MLSDNLKHVLYESNAETIPLEKELQFLDNYIKFQNIRTEGVKQIKYTTKTQTPSYKIAPLLLITIIENAFKHSSLNSEISINITEVNGLLTCICTNDYSKIKTEAPEFKIGLQNLEKRLQLIYKDKYRFVIDKSEKFVVTLTLDLK